MSDIHIFLDLDGTLLNDNNNINSNLRDYILQDEINKYYIITGRSAADSIDFSKTLNLSTPLICNNGSFIYDVKNEKVIYSNDFLGKKNILSDILTFINFSTDNIAISSETTTILLNRNNPRLLNYLVNDNLSHNFNLSTEYIQNRNVQRIIVSVTDKDLKKRIINYILLTYKDVYVDTWRDDNSIIDININYMNKWTSLKFVMHHYDIKIENIVCIGDSMNDYHMLKNVPYSIAMRNSSYKIKEICRYHTQYDNNGDGIIQSLTSLIQGGVWIGD